MFAIEQVLLYKEILSYLPIQWRFHLHSGKVFNKTALLA